VHRSSYYKWSKNLYRITFVWWWTWILVSRWICLASVLKCIAFHSICSYTENSYDFNAFCVVNNKDYFKRFFLSGVYIVNLDMDLTISIDTKYFGLTIMSDQKKYRFAEHVRSKILEFDYHARPKVIWVWRTCQSLYMA